QRQGGAMKDRVLAVTVMAGALVYLYADMQLPRPAIGDALGPKVFPALIGIGLFLSGLMLLFARPRPSPARPGSEPELSPAGRGPPTPGPSCSGSPLGRPSIPWLSGPWATSSRPSSTRWRSFSISIASGWLPIC